MALTVEQLVEAGAIGGRTVQIVAGGDVECARYSVPRATAGQVVIRTVRSAISPGTEMTLYGRQATNVYLHKAWDDDLRLFRQGSPTVAYPLTFGYRAVGEVVESGDEGLPVGTRVYGNWRHTEFVRYPVAAARAQLLPAGLSWDDGVDLGQVGPIGVNAVAHADGASDSGPAVVFGAGLIGLITAQIVSAAGASPVHVVDRLANRLDIAARLGLVPVDATRTADVAYSLKSTYGADAFGAAFDCTGSTHALHEAIRVVRRAGRVVAVGFYQGEARGLYLGDEFHHNGVQLVCGQIGNIHPAWDWAALRRRTVELALERRLVLGGLPRLTRPVDQVAEAFRALQRPAEVLQVALSYE
ncbi:MAG: zinc-binding alcohol dehydrogenase [Chloroflexota bacterium]|nr:zinc-binding alcohol dehydrogenase [Chloroflexota bacterium]